MKIGLMSFSLLSVLFLSGCDFLGTQDKEREGSIFSEEREKSQDQNDDQDERDGDQQDDDSDNERDFQRNSKQDKDDD